MACFKVAYAKLLCEGYMYLLKPTIGITKTPIGKPETPGSQLRKTKQETKLSNFLMYYTEYEMNYEMNYQKIQTFTT